MTNITRHITTAQDYYPFGSLETGRTYSSANYRFGFNGKENDNEVKGTGNQQDYGMRIYDPRLGRFLSVDPLTKDYPWYTPYQFAGNTPIQAIDLDGGEPDYMIDKQGRLTKPMITLLNSAFNYNEKRLSKTRWKEVNFSFGAITIYKTVRYDYSYNYYEFSNPPQWISIWSDLIVHEQKHRNEAGNFILKSLGWYANYGLSWIVSGFSYDRINAEERAYGMEPLMDELMGFRDGMALKVLNSNMSDEEKMNQLNYIGLDFQLTKLQERATKLNEIIGSSSSKHEIRKAERQLNRVSKQIKNIQPKVDEKREEEYVRNHST